VKIPTEFEAAIADLMDAIQVHEKLTQAEREAVTNATNARNRLNTAQKKFDELVATLKKDSPSGSDWARNKGGPNG
jgi:uncharacterized protein YdeI (YjbR/CyaY-like superfamily)